MNETDGSTEAQRLIELAQKLHDDYVKEGLDARDAMVSEAETFSQTMKEKAEAEYNESSNQLQSKLENLRAEVEELDALVESKKQSLKSLADSILAVADGL